MYLYSNLNLEGDVILIHDHSLTVLQSYLHILYAIQEHYRMNLLTFLLILMHVLYTKGYTSFK